MHFRIYDMIIMFYLFIYITINYLIKHGTKLILNTRFRIQKGIILLFSLFKLKNPTFKFN